MQKGIFFQQNFVFGKSNKFKKQYIKTNVNGNCFPIDRKGKLISKLKISNQIHRKSIGTSFACQRQKKVKVSLLRLTNDCFNIVTTHLISTKLFCFVDVRIGIFALKKRKKSNKKNKKLKFYCKVNNSHENWHANFYFVYYQLQDDRSDKRYWCEWITHFEQLQ